MPTAPITIAEVGSFHRNALRFMDEAELEELKWFLAREPEAGVVMKGTGGIRKLRWSASGRGTRGGARVIYYYHDDTLPLWLLAAYPKNKKTDLTANERKQLAALTPLLVAAERERRKQ